MVWSSRAQGNRPYARPTRQAVCKLVTPNSQNSIFCSLCFQSLARSFASSFFTTPLQSVRSALFHKNTGGGYTSQNSLHVFNGLQTLQDSARRGSPRVYLPSMGRRPARPADSFLRCVRAIPPLSCRWSPVVFQWETPFISFPFTPLPDYHPLNEGGYTHPPRSKEFFWEFASG